MPARNIVKTYIENGIYHVYNRGVDKHEIFCDDEDYRVFLRILKDTLSPPVDRKLIQIDITLKGATFKGVPRQPKTFNKEIDCIAYCLMPNHFHVLLQQKKEKSMHEFVRSVSIRYAMYFNKKYHRVGPLFQSAYRAVLVTDEAYLLHVSRYIHINPKELFSNIQSAYSSYAEFLGTRQTYWVKPEAVLSIFGNTNFIKNKHYQGYKDFVEAYIENDINFLGLEADDDAPLKGATLKGYSLRRYTPTSPIHSSKKSTTSFIIKLRKSSSIN